VPRSKEPRRCSPSNPVRSERAGLQIGLIDCPYESRAGNQISTNFLPKIAPTAERVAEVVREYRGLLPKDKNARILDIGFGDGWFMAACRELGYKNICGADFDVTRRAYLGDWGVMLYRIDKDIGDFLGGHPEEFDSIHMSHVIEHIPKYSLLWIGDVLYRALRQDGMLYLRTPNMEGPTPNSSLYVTLAHEYGFCGANLTSLLDICGFDEIRFLKPLQGNRLRQKLGALARWPFIRMSSVKHRLFGVNEGGQFSSELIVTARRRGCPPFFDEKYR
jgi:hypothetical protein